MTTNTGRKNTKTSLLAVLSLLTRGGEEQDEEHPHRRHFDAWWDF